MGDWLDQLNWLEIIGLLLLAFGVGALLAGGSQLEEDFETAKLAFTVGAATIGTGVTAMVGGSKKKDV